ncbi:MAG: hypothetical protein NT116_06385, partial [Candidatus Parcubacteria bacterium]|nr:hypothetical protein [Candidatus Parcubacteria bacterium]
LNNYFIIDSVFKSGGNYIMVGNALDNSLITEGAAKTSDFFAVTNNLIFLNTDAKFCTIAGPSDNTCTGSRQIQKENGIYDFKTQKITINSSSDFGIFPKPDSPTLSLDAQKITIESNLFLNQESNYGSLTLTSDLAPIQSIYAPIVSANEIKILDINNNYIPISSGTKLSLISSIRPRYQRKITITNPLSVPLTDYQVAITIPEDLLSADKMRADGWDLQVYADVNRTQPPLLFFIDIMPKIWVKIPSISANGTKDIYITYGGQVNENPSDPKIRNDYIWHLKR